MITELRNTVVGVFHDHASAQQAVNDLRAAGFTDDQIGVLGRDSGDLSRTADGDTTNDSYAAEGAVTGLAAGAGMGALWGLGIVAAVMPPLGPAIAGGTLAAILSSAAAGAAAAGLAGSLVGMGVPKEDADYYETELHSGRIVVTVNAAGREDDARTILRRYGSYDSANRADLSESLGVSGYSVEAANRPFPTELGADIHSMQHKTVDVPVNAADVIERRQEAEDRR